VIRLRGITWEHRRGFDPLVATAKSYHQLRPDVVVEWERMSFHDCYHTSRNHCYNGITDVDFVAFDYPNTGDYAANGWVLPLDELMTPAQKADLEADADPRSLESYHFDGHLWGLPIDAACHILVYRPDLLGVDGTALPRDWDSLLQLAREIHKPPERYAFSNGGGSGGAAFLMLEGILGALGCEPFTEPESRIDRPAGLRALEILRQVNELSMPGEIHPSASGYELLSGDDRVAMALGPFAYINYYGADNPRVLGAADMPTVPETGRTSSNLGGVGLGIHSWSKHPEEAWEYAWYVMNQEVQQGVYIENEGQPGRLSALRGEFSESQRGGFGRFLVDALDDGYLRPTRPGYHYLEHSCYIVTGRFLAGETDAETTLAELDRVAAAMYREGSRSGKWRSDELPADVNPSCWC
jgi:multiple sugar transport system substrate-binding protein